MIKSLFWLLVLVADIWAVIQVIQSKATTGAKVLWCLLILVFPVIGLIIWYFAGPGKKTV